MKALLVDALASGKGERKSTRDVIGAGPRVVAGILEMRGIETLIIEAEATMHGLPEGFDALFLSGMTSDIPTMRKVRGFWQEGPVLIGGPATSDPESTIRKLRGDLAVIGEGEETLTELLKLGLNKGVLPPLNELKTIRGISFKSDRDIEVNSLRPVMPRRTYDCYTPSTLTIRGYHLYFAARVYVEVLRGCSNYHRAEREECDNCGVCREGSLEGRYYCHEGIPPGCGYCSVPSLFGPPKSRSANNIAEEIKALLNEGVTRFVLSAPDFLDYGRDLLVEPEPLTDPRNPEPNYEEIERLLSTLTKLHRLEDGTSSIMIENLKASLVTERAARILGTYLADTPVSIGFETGHKGHSDSLGRPSTPEETLTAVKRLKKTGLKPYVYFIHGLPMQSRETVDETVKAIGSSMKSGAERVILYRFQSLPMSAFSFCPSAPPNIKDPESKRIFDAAAKANMEAKESMIGRLLRVVIAERYNRDRRFFVAYPLKHGPVVLVESSEHLEGRVIDVEVTRVASERMVQASPVAMF